MTPLLLLAGLALILLVAHLRAQYDRERRLKAELRREYPTTFGGRRL